MRGPSLPGNGRVDDLRRAGVGRDESWWQTRQYAPSMAEQLCSGCSQRVSALQAMHMMRLLDARPCRRVRLALSVARSVGGRRAGRQGFCTPSTSTHQSKPRSSEVFVRLLAALHGEGRDAAVTDSPDWAMESRVPGAERSENPARPGSRPDSWRTPPRASASGYGWGD
jgi:hypothetical protein